MGGRRGPADTFHVSQAPLWVQTSPALVSRCRLWYGLLTPFSSLEKPWNEPPPELYLQTVAYGEVDPSKQQLNYLPPTPVSATSFQQEKQQLRPLPPALLDLVKSTPAQKGITNYDDVHAWWWIAYDKVLEGLKQGLEAPWKEVDSFVHRR